MPRKPKEENDAVAKAIGEELTKAMERLRISITELYKRTGISRTVLLAYTRGTYAPGARELKLLCQHLDVTPNVLLYGSNQPATTPYKLGDMPITEKGMQTIAFLTLLSQLTTAEKAALMTLAESICMARDPEQHREALKAIQQALTDPAAQAAALGGLAAADKSAH